MLTAMIRLAETTVDSMTDPFSPRAVLQALDWRRTALFFDVDGTLLDIAPHPDAVIVPPGLREDLVSLATRLSGALALTSGRTIDRLDQFFAPMILPAAGAHGAELRFDPDQGDVEAAAPHLPDVVRAALQGIVRDLPGVMLEDKGRAIAVHYRANPEASRELWARITGLLASLAGLDLAVTPGHCVLEVKSAGHDKGTALAAFMRHPRFEGRTPIIVGDDVTDETAFRAANALGGLAISVGREVDGAPHLFADAVEVRAWIRRLLADAEVAA